MSPFSPEVTGLTEAQVEWILEQGYLDLPQQIRDAEELDQRMLRLYREHFGDAACQT